MTPPASALPLAAWAGADLMLIDQVLRGRVAAPARVADLGCGGGRNVGPLLLAGCSVWGCDTNPAAIDACRQVARVAGGVTEQFLVEALEETSLEAGTFDLVLANAVLHFAENRKHFDQMVSAMLGLVAPGGLLLARLATADHWPQHIPVTGFTYLPQLAELKRHTHTAGLRLADPLKTVVIDELRTMTTWVATRS